MAAGINDTFRQVGADEISELTAGTGGASGERSRELVEAASSGTLDQALAAVPAGSRQNLADAAGEGFLAGLNQALTLGALLSFAGGVLAAWLVREREIERHEVGPERPEVESSTPLVEPRRGAVRRSSP